jgi:hypothetical protein
VGLSERIEVRSVAARNRKWRLAGAEPRHLTYLIVNVKHGVRRSTVGTAGGSASINR